MPLTLELTVSNNEQTQNLCKVDEEKLLKNKTTTIISPLYEWAYEMSKGDATKECAFSYLEKGEMTFNKERNPPPPESIHQLKIQLDSDLLKQIKTS